MTDLQVIEYYRTKLAEQQASVARCASRWNGMGYLRGGSFLVSLVPLILALNSVWGITTGWLMLAGLLFLVFLFIAYLHEGMQSELRRASLLSAMHRESLARCERKWSEIRVPEIEVPKRFLPISTDLDLLGENSVYKLLGVTRTPLGTETLRSWIIEGALPAEIKLRQEAVAELRNEFDWRLKFRFLCETLASGQSGPSRFVEWSESPNWFAGFQWVLWLARLTAVGSILAIGLLVAGLIPLTIAGPILMLTCGINFLLSVFFAGTIHDVFNRISSRTDEALHYVSMFDMVSGFPAKSEKLKSLQVLLHNKEHDRRKICIVWDD